MPICRRTRNVFFSCSYLSAISGSELANIYCHILQFIVYDLPRAGTHCRKLLVVGTQRSVISRRTAVVFLIVTSGCQFHPRFQLRIVFLQIKCCRKIKLCYRFVKRSVAVFKNRIINIPPDFPMVTDFSHGIPMNILVITQYGVCRTRIFDYTFRNFFYIVQNFFRFGNNSVSKISAHIKSMVTVSAVTGRIITFVKSDKPNMKSRFFRNHIKFFIRCSFCCCRFRLELADFLRIKEKLIFLAVFQITHREIAVCRSDFNFLSVITQNIFVVRIIKRFPCQ